MSSDVAIRVDGLSKCYHIYEKPSDRLAQMLLRGRRKMYREFWALKDVSFEIRKGETVGIIGRNGSGKSTLLQLICGTLNPTNGAVHTSGRIAALLELGSGFNPEFTGRENVYMNAAVLGLKKDEIDAKFDAIAAFADIGNFIDQPVKFYSSGMTVRLAFSVQAMIDPDILIVDEALAVGDEKFQRKCFARIEELSSKNATILFVSHTASQIVELCDKAILMEGGEQWMAGSPMLVTRAYQKLIYSPDGESIQREKLISLVSEQNLERTPSPETGATHAATKRYDPNLVPETTVVYPTQGAIIENVGIFDGAGEQTNILQQNRSYCFKIDGKILASSEGIYIGIHIRTISGIVITGQRYPEEGKYISNIIAGQDFSINFGFNMLLLPGTYFVGCGIWSKSEPLCQHRIIDAIMFRVEPGQKTQSFGYVDASFREPSIKFSN